jgi:hypothetical protein
VAGWSTASSRDLTLNTANYGPKRVFFTYVLSQHKNKGPYKVGMSKGDLWRRMGNYQAVFVNFWVYYLVPVPYADVFTTERYLHGSVSGRVPFPTRDRTRLSEWFDCTPRDLRRAFIALAKDPDLGAVGGCLPHHKRQDTDTSQRLASLRAAARYGDKRRVLPGQPVARSTRVRSRSAPPLMGSSRQASSRGPLLYSWA